jgi:L-ascorbate metabolism protein UlaG (beta-lactamase superfamily)
MLYILIIIISIIAIPQIIGFILSAPSYNGPKSDHFDGTYFSNISGAKVKGFRDIIKWQLNADRGEWYEVDMISDYPDVSQPSQGQWKVTFINHSTFLLQTGKLNILTDPIWSDRTSPVSFAGPRRKAPPGLRWEDLPKIDVVLISHNHYDHLDVPTVRKLWSEQAPRFYAPLGVSRYLKKLGVEKSTDMDWWEESQITDEIGLACVPTQHFSGRGTFDRNKTLWAGYVLKTAAGNVYFAGDSGYGDFFKDIGEKYGPMEISMIPIGAYKPIWFMSPVHVSPIEAVQVHLDVGSKKSIAMHFGTFPLGEDGMDEPIDDLKKALASRGLADGDFVALGNGGQLFAG